MRITGLYLSPDYGALLMRLCASQGMVFIANPSTADPIDQFILNAKASAASASPSYFSPSLMNTLT